MRLRTILLVPALVLAARSVRAQDAQADHDRAALIAMKSDLRNLVTAQESYFADHSAYASEMEGLKFRSSQNVTVRLTVTKNNGWAAETRSALLPNVACMIWVNIDKKERPKAMPEGAGEGEPACAKLEEKH